MAIKEDEERLEDLRRKLEFATDTAVEARDIAKDNSEELQNIKGKIEKIEGPMDAAASVMENLKPFGIVVAKITSGINRIGIFVYALYNNKGVRGIVLIGAASWLAFKDGVHGIKVAIEQIVSHFIK